MSRREGRVRPELTHDWRSQQGCGEKCGLDLPFREAVFATVLSMGMLHLFEDGNHLLHGLRRSLQPRGRLYISSLVLNDRRGDRYLRFLERRGEVAACRRVDEVKMLVAGACDHVAQCGAVGNIAYAIAGVR